MMKNLPQYDFRAYSGFLTSLGASLHLSWHFGLFQRDEFALGVSLMEDIIRGNAHPHPFWVTELQGGTVIWSGRVPYYPTKEHIAQYLWTSVGAGAEGVIFWTLNQRKAVQEGGEWGMLNFEGRPSDRLEETAKVAAAVKENAPLFEGLKPYEPDVTILYNVKSLQMQKRDSDLWPSPETGRKETSVMCSLIASYQALASWGINAQVRDMDNFDWSNSEGLIAIIPDMICIPSDKTEAIREFVKNGGKLIVTGRSGYFDENMRCAFMGGHPLEDVLGGKLLEFKYTDDYFKIGGLDSHLWRGIIRRSAFSSEPVASYNGETSAIWHPYGKGEVVWFPSMIELGAYHRDIIPLAKFIGKECRKVIDKAPFHLCKPVKGVLARTMTDDNGNMLIVLVNKTGKKVRLRPSLRLGKSSTNIIYGGDVASVRRCRIVLKKEATVVISTAASK
ncbi:MAG: beta-galactosidase trimerization domain-containing protein [Bacteroidales bacterium]|nr:beta-galactosidase trimerization domain-containing protein [Bacteroidales bacterium]